MVALFVWLAGIVLEGALLYRGWRASQFCKFPLFYSYIGLVFLQSIFLYVVGTYYPPSYADVYWALEFVDVFAGCGVVLEIYRVGLQEFPGAARLARNGLLLVFFLTIGRVLLTAQEGSRNWSTMMTIQLERDMRFVEIAALLTLLVLFLCYAIPISRNLRGILFGYGLFLGINILNLTLMRRFGADVEALASYVQSFTYIFVLGVWTVLLWSPSLQTASGAPADGYQGILQQTNSRLGKTRSFVRGALGL
jgi:hypothetical protein